MVEVKDDFSFFLQFCTPLVLNLPDVKDRSTAAQWLKKLRELHAKDLENNIYVEYLKLLLFITQKNKLTGIFQDPPPDGPLKTFPGLNTAIDMTVLVKPSQNKVCGLPPIHMSFGGDLCEFIAIQEIPNFGLHGYYAVSPDPLPTWVQPRFGVLKMGKSKSANGNQFRGLKPFPINKNNNYLDASRNDNVMKNVSLKENTITDTLQNKNATQGKSLLQKTHQIQRRQIPSMETRPCWSRNRYIDRLIDQSPHVVGDLDVPQTNALLHAYKDRKMKIADTKPRDPCELSTSRKIVEMMMSTSPCLFVPDGEDIMRRDVEEDSYYDYNDSIGAETMVDGNMLETSSGDVDWWNMSEDSKMARGPHYSGYPDDLFSTTPMSFVHQPLTEFQENTILDSETHKRGICSAASNAKSVEKQETQKQVRAISRSEPSPEKVRRPSRNTEKQSLDETFKPVAHSSFIN